MALSRKLMAGGLAALTLLATAGAAMAAPAYVTSNVNVRSGPGTGYSIVGSLNDGAGVSISCQTTGTSISGTYGTSNIWDKIGSGRYVPDAYIYTGSDGRVAPNC